MQPSKPQPFRLPQRFDSPTLAKYAIPGEPTVIVRAVGVGSTAPFEYSDRNGRQAIFRYEREYDAHVLKVPASVWNHNKGFMAHELMDQRRLPHPLVVTVEVPAIAGTSPSKSTAWRLLIDAMKADPEYAWSWHCNLAMAMHDSGAGPHQACNRGAALFLSLLSDGAVDTTQHPAYENTQVEDSLTTEELHEFQEAILSPRATISKSQDGQEAKSSGPYPENASASLAPATIFTAIQDAIRHADLTNPDWPDAILNMVTNPGAKGYLEAKLTDLGSYLATDSTEFRDAFLSIFNDMLVSPVAPAAKTSPKMDAPGNSESASDVVVGQAETQPGASATLSVTEEINALASQAVTQAIEQVIEGNASTTFSGPGLTGDEEVTDEAIKAFSSFQAPTGNAPATFTDDQTSPFSPDGSGTDMPRKNEPAGDDALPFLAGSAWTLCEKPQRLKDLAGALNTDAETLKNAIAHPLSTVELGHAGWVKRREPQA